MDIRTINAKPISLDAFSANSQAMEAQVSRLPSSQAVKQVQESKDSQAAQDFASQAKPKPEDVKSAVDSLNKTLKSMQQSLEFTVDDDTGVTVVKLIDLETKEVVRQTPSEEILNIAKAIDKFQGLLIKDKA